MTVRTEIELTEKTVAPVTATLTSDGETAIPSDRVDSIVMTLIDQRTGAVINDRENQNVLDDNDCTYHATSGLFTWELVPADTTIVDDTPPGLTALHLATITVTWDTDKTSHFEILLIVKNLRKVPQA